MTEKPPTTYSKPWPKDTAPADKAAVLMRLATVPSSTDANPASNRSNQPAGGTQQTAAAQDQSIQQSGQQPAGPALLTTLGSIPMKDSDQKNMTSSAQNKQGTVQPSTATTFTTAAAAMPAGQPVNQHKTAGTMLTNLATLPQKRDQDSAPASSGNIHQDLDTALASVQPEPRNNGPQQQQNAALPQRTKSKSALARCFTCDWSASDDEGMQWCNPSIIHLVCKSAIS